MKEIDVKGMGYKELNEQIRAALKDEKETEFVLKNVNGQRYIGDNVAGPIKFKIEGVPGNDLGFSMDGPEVEIFGNGQDAICNTMSNGKVIIHGNAGDICGYAMRGGKIFIKGNVGYRAGIHMKEYQDVFPTIVIGGRAGDFLGEYMAGGMIVILGLHDDGKPIVGNFCGTGMHGGEIFMNGEVEDWKLGKEVKVKDLTKEEITKITTLLKEYEKDLGLDLKGKYNVSKFKKLYPGTSRPYGKLYAY